MSRRSIRASPVYENRLEAVRADSQADSEVSVRVDKLTDDINSKHITVQDINTLMNAITHNLQSAYEFYGQNEMQARSTNAELILRAGQAWIDQGLSNKVLLLRTAVKAYQNIAFNPELHQLLNHHNLPLLSTLSLPAVTTLQTVLTHPNLISVISLTEDDNRKLLSDALSFPQSISATVTKALENERAQIVTFLELVVKGYLSADGDVLGTGFKLLERLIKDLLKSQWNRTDEHSEQALLKRRFETAVKNLGDDIDQRVKTWVDVAWKGEDGNGGKKKEIVEAIGKQFETPKTGENGLEANVDAYAKKRLELKLYGGEGEIGSAAEVKTYLEGELPRQWNGTDGRRRIADDVKGLVEKEAEVVWKGTEQRRGGFSGGGQMG
jgi:hypothetical protein